MVQKCLRRVCALALLAAASNAGAELGRVEWYNSKCGLVLVKTDVGYAFAQQLSAGMITEGDTLDGDFERDARTHNIKNTSNQTQLMIWIERFSTSKKIAMERVPPNCKPEEAPAATQ